MKRGTVEHPKTKALARALKIPQYSAVGILESLWHWTAQFAPAGDVGRYENSDIADGVHWDGDAEKLVAALVSCRWLDEHDEHRLVIHDWSTHADDAVNLVLARRTTFFTDGTRPKLTRLAKPERERIQSQFDTHGAHTECTLPIPSHPLPKPSPPIAIAHAHTKTQPETETPTSAPVARDGNEREQSKPDERTGHGLEHERLVSELIAAGVDGKEAKHLALRATPQRIREVIGISKQGNVSNPGGLIRDLIVQHSRPDELTSSGTLARQLESIQQSHRQSRQTEAQQRRAAKAAREFPEPTLELRRI